MGKHDFSTEHFNQMNKLIRGVINNRPIEEKIIYLSEYLQEIQGDIYYVIKNETGFVVYDKNGDEQENTSHYLESKTFKEIINSKKRYINNNSEDFYLGLPIVHKNIFLGAILIKEKNLDVNLNKLKLVSNYLILTLDYYTLKEIERNHTIKDLQTNLYNKRHFQYQLELEEEKRLRYNQEIDLTLLIIKLDNFYELVEAYDYDFAEKTFIYLSEIVLKQSRKADMPARIEENEIGILMPHTNELGSKRLSERIMNSLKKQIKINNRKVNMQIKVAMGTMKYGENKDDFLKRVKSDL